MKNKTTILVLTFVAGAIIGAAIVWLLCCNCCKKECVSKPPEVKFDSTGITRITAQKAKLLSQTYMFSPLTVVGLKAFTINFDQFNAMKIIAGRDSTVHGFRIYMGMDKKTPVRMVVGTGSPDKTDDIYLTDSDDSGPCPEVCDDAGPPSDK
jgi:hypothetical protein